jgi:pyridoxal phosphate phosphatase PHOSPHO2
MAAVAAQAAPPALPLPLPLAVVFDYDYSLINVNSDTWVFQQLAPAVHSHIVTQSAARKGEWTRIVDEALVLAQGEHGVSKDALLHTLSEVPVLEGMTEALREAHGAGAEVHIVSDASQAFIEAFLRRRDLLGLVSSIRTNSSWTDAAGHLRVSAYQAERGGPHGCPLCPVNLCKGAVLRELRLGGADPRRVLFIGDGGGDFCPVRTLRAGDVALVRKDASVESALGLAKRIEAMKEAYPVRAQVLHWVNGEQVLRAVRDAIRDARRVVR